MQGDQLTKVSFMTDDQLVIAGAVAEVQRDAMRQNAVFVAQWFEGLPKWMQYLMARRVNQLATFLQSRAEQVNDEMLSPIDQERRMRSLDLEKPRVH